VTCGFSDLGTRRPITPRTLFEIGSIGKSFTGILLLQEKAAGRLELDAPVTRYLPWFQVKSSYDAITVHHLMCHTAGIVRGTDVSPHGRYEAYALRNTQAASPLGKNYHYSDVAYKLLGFLLEAVLDRPSPDILRSHILDPLGMTETHAVMTFATRANYSMDPGAHRRPMRLPIRCSRFCGLHSTTRTSRRFHRPFIPP
jgi:D-alanyl-D-alanine carboxypeptidase